MSPVLFVMLTAKKLCVGKKKRKSEKELNLVSCRDVSKKRSLKKKEKKKKDTKVVVRPT